MKGKRVKESKGRIKPTIRRSDVTRFYDLSDDEFERLCRDLHGKQKGISTCNLFGLRRQVQKGVDHIADRESGDGKEVGQSKCYTVFGTGDLKSAVEPFFTHLTYWKEQNVRRYILFVACDVERTQVHEEKENQRKRFKAEGILFELWSGRDIERHLQPHRDLVEKYIDSREIQDKICGSREPTIVLTEQYRTLELNYEAVSTQRTVLADAFSEAKLQLVEDLRETFRRGKRIDAMQGMRRLFEESQDNWLSLNAFARGQILRIMALYTLNVEGDKENALVLIERARQENPEGDDAVLRAVLIYKRGDKKMIENALEIAQSSNSVEALNFQGSLLIELDRYEDTLNLLDNSPLSAKGNSETYRLRALAHLCLGNLAEARAYIGSAFKENPDWYPIRFTKGLVDYWTAYPPSTLRLLNPLIPAPAPLDLVKQDQESLNYLDSAERSFYELESGQQISDDEKWLISLWRLAALSMHPDRINEADERCLVLLQTRPTDSLLVRWVLSRNFSVDRNTLEGSILEKINTTPEPERYIDLVTVLMGLLLEDGDYHKAFGILNKYRNIFEFAGHIDIWLYWRSQTQIASGKKLSIANKTVSQISNGQIRTQLIAKILEIECRQKDDWTPLFAHYESAYNENANVLNLLEACRLKAFMKDYRYVLIKEEQLIDALGTPAVVYLLANSAWQAKEYKTCLKVIERCRTFFSKAILPHDLRRLSVMCERELGFLPEALQEAKDLVTTTGSTQNIIALMQVQLDYGNLAGIRECAQKLLGKEDTLPTDLLNAANIVQFIDIDLAKAIFQKALQHDIEPNLVCMAISLGHRLGLESIIYPLNDRIWNLARQGKEAFRPVTLAQIIELQKAHSEKVQYVTSSYDKGQIPIHLISDRLNVPLSRILHETLAQNESDPSPLVRPPVFLRFGNRHLRNIPKMGDVDCQLYLDVTALLVATHLELTDILERIFPVLRISASIQHFLLSEIQRLTHNQPSRLDAQKQIKELVDFGIIQNTPSKEQAIDIGDSFYSSMGSDWMHSLLSAIDCGGFIVDFLPLHSHDIDMRPVSIPEKYSGLIVGIGEIIESLVHNHLITDEQHRQLLKSGFYAVNSGNTVSYPNIGKNLFLMGGIAEAIASMGLLSKVCQHYRVFMGERETKSINAEIEQEERNATLRRWLDLLRERIRVGLEKGKYQVIKREETLGKTVAGEDTEPHGPFLSTLSDLLSLISRPSDIVWFDDRFLSSFSTNNNGAIIVGIVEVLGLLKAMAEINEDFYYEKLNQLRAANVRYIPLSKDELLYHIYRATVCNGILIETKELSTIRRYWAACLLDKERLRCKPLQPDEKHELGFLVWSGRAIQDAITECWAGERIANDLARVRSDWLFHNLYTGIYGCRHLLHDPNPASERFDLIGIDLGGMLTAAIGLRSNAMEGMESPQAGYLGWLKARLITDQFKVNPDAVISTASLLETTLLDLLSEEKGLSEKHKRVERSLINRFLLKMPPEILRELDRKPGFLEQFGVKYTSTVNLKDIEIKAADYWSAAAKASTGTPQFVFSAGVHPIKLQIKWVLDQFNCPSIVLMSVDDKLHLTNSDPALGVLWEDVEVRLAALERSRNDLDCDDMAYHKMREDITIIHAPLDRIEYMTTRRDSSYAFYCRSLLQKLIDRDSINQTELLPPSLESILIHFRVHKAELSDTFNSVDTYSRIAARLLAECGLAEAIERLSCVPVPIPNDVCSALYDLPVYDRTSLIVDVAERWTSPVSMLHLLKLSLQDSRHDEKQRGIALKTYSRLWEEKAGANGFVEAFLKLIRWFEAEFSNWREFRDLPAQVRLFCLWAHSSRICNIFGKAGADMEIIIHYLDSHVGGATHMVFYYDTAYSEDVLNPSHLSKAHFTCHALSNVLSEISDQDLSLLPVNADVASLLRDFLEGKQASVLTLLRDTSLQQNCLNSLFGGDRGLLLTRIAGGELAEPFLTSSLHQAAKKRVFGLRENPYSARDWIDLAAIVGDLPIYSDLRDDFLSVVEAINIEELYLSDRTSLSLSLPMICEQIALFGSEDLFQKIKDHIVRLTVLVERDRSRNSREADNEQPNIDTILIFLLNGIYIMSRRWSSPLESSLFFSETMEHILRGSPRLCQLIYYPLRLFAAQLPASQMHGIWKLVLISRAMVDRVGGD